MGRRGSAFAVWSCVGALTAVTFAAWGCQLVWPLKDPPSADAEDAGIDGVVQSARGPAGSGGSPDGGADPRGVPGPRSPMDAGGAPNSAGGGGDPGRTAQADAASPADDAGRPECVEGSFAACGDAAIGECDGADSCDGESQCLRNIAPDGTPCAYGQFCGGDGSCRSGRCVPPPEDPCGLNQACDRQTWECECQGCLIGNSCVAGGLEDPNNSCLVCDPEENAFGYTPAPDKECGGPPESECHLRSTCSLDGQCEKRFKRAGEPCGSQDRESCSDPNTCSGDGSCLPNDRDGELCSGTIQGCTYACMGTFCDSRVPGCQGSGIQ